MIREYAEAAQTETDARSGSTSMMAKFKQTVANVRSALITAFETSGILETFTEGMTALLDVVNTPEVWEKVNHYLQSFSSGLSDFLEKFRENPVQAIKDKFLEMVSDLWNTTIKFIKDKGPSIEAKIKEYVPIILTSIKDTLVSGIKSLWDNPLVVGALVGGVATLLGAKMLSGRGTGGGGGGGGGGSGGVRSGLGGLLGGLTGGLLTGIADGLAAFAQPGIVIGAGKLALAITAIATGIGAGAFIIGKTLPTFAKGLESFEDIDGEKLKAVGEGMLLLGGGLAAMGAGEVVGFFGKIAGLAGKGWDLITGADSPIEKLQKFADQKITEDQVAQIELNTRAMKAYATGMAAFGSGTATSGVGSILQGIGSWLNEGAPLDKLKEFANQKFTFTQVEQINNNVLALEAYASGMSAVGNIVSPGVMESISESMSGWFSDSPLEQLQEFADENINITGLRDNLQAVEDFQTVYGGMSGSGGATRGGIKKLDIENVSKYAEAIDELTEALERMNDQLSKDNNGWTPGKGTNAGDILGQTNKSNSENDVNTRDILRILEEIRENTRKSYRAIDELGNVN
jgi:hypothetical protein